jgi:hypothetical protein
VLRGTVIDARTQSPVPGAAVAVGAGERWTVTDDAGVFRLPNMAPGAVRITVACLGYVKKTVDAVVADTLPEVVVALEQDNLRLADVVITAQPDRDGATSSYIIDRASLEHLQMLNIADALSLLPGAQTNHTQHLATNGAQHLAVRSNIASEDGNPTFGTGIEVDGVRLAHNATFNADGETRLYGVDTRTVATANVASIEVVTGIPSVQYGDLTNGLVKVQTISGASPLQATAATKPHTRHAALGKGFALGRRGGVLNVSAEHTLSIADPASPYTSYVRNSVQGRYKNTFNKRRGRPLTLEAGVAATVGGYHSAGDPDAFVDTYTKARGNTLRAHVRAAFLPDFAWLTNLEGQFSINYADERREARTNKSNSASIAAAHGTEEGYFVATRYDTDPAAAVILIPPGYWYQTAITDSRPVTFAGHLKGYWTRRWGAVRNTLLAGVELTGERNAGAGLYYDDRRYAPSGWRPYRFAAVPTLYHTAWYVENKMRWGLGGTQWLFVAGVRGDATAVDASLYGAVAALSPRFSLRYRIIERPQAMWLRSLTLTGGWGKAVKLPSFEVLYPRASYRDLLAFAPGTMADGTSFTAYYISPHTAQHNPALRWQQSRQWEVGLEAKIGQGAVTIAYFYHLTRDPYRYTDVYTPFSYKFTGQEALEQSTIASVNRNYVIDRTTGVVTVIDRTGALPSEALAYRERRTFKSNEVMTNGTPFARQGVEWVIDFGKIPLLHTSVRFDGQYYRYRSLDETLLAYSPTAQTMADGNPYKYVGYYVGGSSSGGAAVSNGRETRRLTANLTVTTHLPAIRLILSLRVESTLYNYSRYLSAYSGGGRGFAVEHETDNFPSGNPATDNTDRYVVVYPLYYSSYDDMTTLVPFAEAYAAAFAAREHDPAARALYNELSKLLLRTNTNYYFNADRLSACYSLSLSVTKELGDVATLAFSATNFTNNAQQVRSSARGTQISVYGSTYIPKFYYSLTLKVKL